MRKNASAIQTVIEWVGIRASGAIRDGVGRSIPPRRSTRRPFSSGEPKPSWSQKAQSRVSTLMSEKFGSLPFVPRPSGTIGLAAAAQRDRASALKRNLQRALSLHAEAAWQTHRAKFVGAGILISVMVMWRVMYGTASYFLTLSESIAETGFLALSAAIVSFTYLYVRSLNQINPNKVYRMAMVHMNSSPGLLEVLGAPLSGSEIRAYVITGRSLKLSDGLVPKLRSRRIQMIFPVRGAERRGLVTLEAKKRHGKYELKLLAVDIPSGGGGGDQRFYLQGTETIFARGGVLSELRDPFVRALSMKEEYDREDDADDEEEESREEREKEVEKKRFQRREAIQAQSGNSLGAQQSRSLYAVYDEDKIKPWERFMCGAEEVVHKVKNWSSRLLRFRD